MLLLKQKTNMTKINSKQKKIIEENPISLATINKSNNPHVIVVAYVKVISPNQILITDNFMTQTIKNLEYNNQVSLVVWDQKWKSCQLNGAAQYFTKGKWKKYVQKMKENKGLPSKGAVLITLSSLIQP